MYKIFGIKEDVDYVDREGAYLIPICENAKLGIRAMFGIGKKLI